MLDIKDTHQISSYGAFSRDRQTEKCQNAFFKKHKKHLLR